MKLDSKRLIGYAIVFLLGSMSAVVNFMIKYSNPEMLNELIFYIQKGEVFSYFFMFLTLDFLFLFPLIIAYIFISLKKKNDNKNTRV